MIAGNFIFVFRQTHFSGTVIDFYGVDFSIQPIGSRKRKQTHISQRKTVPTELLSKEFGVIYQTLEKSEDYKIGETTAYETPYDHGKVIDTEYGFYRVAITNAGKRIATGENGKTSIEGLTKEVYQQYLDGTELQADVKTGLEYYFVGSINELYDSNQQNLLIAELRNGLTAQVAFTNAAYKDVYTSMLECIEKNIEFAIKEAELEEE